MEMVKEKEAKSSAALKDAFGYSNDMSAPHIEKVVVNTGVGSMNDKRRVELTVERLAKITGQRPAQRGAKKSIASFKVREGDIVGYATTLRGERMYAFLDKLIHIALPRTRDFKGIKRTAVDSMGNLTIGIKEHTIFPETSDEDLKDVFGLSVTIVTTAGSKKEALAFFEYLGIPFVKEA
jgi:large subunit ribosomal protein L5